MKEATKAELKEVFSLKRIMWVLIGNTIYSCGIAAFVLPNDLITGGTTGIALILEHYFGLPIGLSVAIFNIVMFILAILILGKSFALTALISTFYFLPIGLSVAIFNIVMFILAILILGKSFALTALISTFYFPWILSQFQKVQFIQNMTDDFLLGSIFAGLMLGLGVGLVIRAGASTGGMDIPPLIVGLVIRAGASTGGMDIPPLILNKKFGLPVSIGLYVFDFTILIIQMSFRDKERILYGILLVLIYSTLVRDKERILYGILLVLIYSTLVDKVLLMGKTQMQVKIISDHYEEINKVIQEKLDRGSTFFKTESGYLRKDSFAIMTVVSSRELPKLNELVLEIDKQAFIVINQVNEVMGRGFTLHKQAE